MANTKSSKTSNSLAYICVALFLGAIVGADLLVTHFGPSALPYTAFFLIPFDLVTRDILHERWAGKYLWLKMFGLILTGACIAYVLNREAIHVARASVLAFTAATLMNTLIYHLLRNKKLFVKMNTSNLFAAISDSLIFPYVAFGVLPIDIVVHQSSSKFIGGIVWSFLFIKVFKLRT